VNRRATIVFAATWLVLGSYPGSAGRRIAPLCNRLHHGKDCLFPRSVKNRVSMSYRRADGSANPLVALDVSRPAALEPRQQLWCNIPGLERQ